MSLMKKITGYEPKIDRKAQEQERKRALGITEQIASEQARQWLERHGIHRSGMTRKERTAANMEYMRRLKTLPKPEPTAWAFEIVSRIVEGEIVSPWAEKCARDVSGVKS